MDQNENQIIIEIDGPNFGTPWSFKDHVIELTAPISTEFATG